MRSESTRALGQPSETKPTLGAAFGRARAFSGAVFFAAFILGLGVAFRIACGTACGLIVLRLRERICGGKVGEGEGAEQVTRLLLQLLLHLEERIGALLKIAAHHALDRGTLHLEKFAPRV